MQAPGRRTVPLRALADTHIALDAPVRTASEALAAFLSQFRTRQLRAGLLFHEVPDSPCHSDHYLHFHSDHYPNLCHSERSEESAFNPRTVAQPAHCPPVGKHAKQTKPKRGKRSLSHAHPILGGTYNRGVVYENTSRSPRLRHRWSFLIDSAFPIR